MMKLLDQIRGSESQVHKVAEATAVTLAVLVLTATSFAKICHRRKFGIERTTCVPALVAVVNGSLCFGFPFVSCINISNEVISHIVANMKLKEMTKLCQFAVEIFVNRVKAFLEFFFCELAHRVMSRVMIYIGKEDCLGERWSYVLS